MASTSTFNCVTPVPKFWQCNVTLALVQHIAVGAEYEVNLSYWIRQKLTIARNTGTGALSFMTPRDMSFMFKGVAREAFGLMQDTFRRWRYTDDFEKYVGMKAKSTSKATNTSMVQLSVLGD